MNLGQIGEDLAVVRLQESGWTILSRNLKFRVGELDIVCRDPRGELVFVEVKTMRQGLLQPEHHLTNFKLKKVARAAEVFIAKHPHLIRASGWRIDAIAIVLTKDNKISEIRNYKNIGSR